MTAPRIVGDLPIGRDTLPDFGGVAGATPVVSPLADSVIVSVVSLETDPKAPAAEADPASVRDTAVDHPERPEV